MFSRIKIIGLKCVPYNAQYVPEIATFLRATTLLLTARIFLLTPTPPYSFLCSMFGIRLFKKKYLKICKKLFFVFKLTDKVSEWIDKASIFQRILQLFFNIFYCTSSITFYTSY